MVAVVPHLQWILGFLEWPPQLWSWWVLVPELTYLPRPRGAGSSCQRNPSRLPQEPSTHCFFTGTVCTPYRQRDSLAMLGGEREEAWALRHWQGLPCSHTEFLSAIRISRGGCPISSSHSSLCLGASEGQGLGRRTEAANTYLSLK